MTNNLLILERSTTELEFKQDGGVYILEGIFGEIDKKNKNNRIYTEAEYLPQIESLQAKIKASKLLGELDHPANFDVSLKNVSHMIEELTYDKETKQVKGRIKLLDTEAGRQAKALVDAGVPLQISSRAAGAVESNGQVKIKQLFTYDLVADPGFENAELKRVNEEYGFINENNLFIYEINNINEKQPIQNINETKMAESKFITVEDFNKYSQYLSGEIKTIKEGMNSLKDAESTNSQLTSLKEYTDYLAKKLDESIQYSEHIAERADQGISYSEKLAETLDNSIQYSEHIVEGVDAIKNYTNYLAESYNEGATTHENLTKYIEYLRENLEKVTEYAEYVAETVNSNLLLEDETGKEIEQIEAENDAEDVTIKTVDADGNALTHNAIQKDLADKLELEGEGELHGKEITEASITLDVTDPKAKDLLKLLKKNNVKMKNLGEGPNGFDEVELTGSKKNLMAVISDEDAGWGDPDLEDYIEESNGVYKVKVKSLFENGAGIPAEDLEDETEDVTIKTVDADGNALTHNAIQKDLADKLELEGEGELHGKEIDAMEAYKNSITSKLEALIESSKVKSSEPSFFKFISESKRNEFNQLNDEEKSKVISSIEGRGYLTEGQILGLWSNSLMGSRSIEDTTPTVISMMPSEYHETWNKLSEGKKNQIMAQSKMHRLETEYQVRNFWQTRDLRETAPVMEKITMINESKVEVKPTVGYDTTEIAAQIAARFKK
jgi:predicted transcriptional regulator